jgi:hypothetical protein
MSNNDDDLTLAKRALAGDNDAAQKISNFSPQLVKALEGRGLPTLRPEISLLTFSGNASVPVLYRVALQPTDFWSCTAAILRWSPGS